MRNFLHSFAALYAKTQASLTLQSLATFSLLLALSIGALTFGVTISCLLLAVSVMRTDVSIMGNGPPMTLFLVFALSGLFNDPQLSLMVGVAAVISTPAIAAVGNRGTASLGAQTMSILSAWLPPGLLTVSLTILASRDRSLVALFLTLIYFHDLGLQLCARSPGFKRFSPILASTGAITLLWTALQISLSPIPHEWFWPFAALVGFGMPISRIFTELLVVHRWKAARLIASYMLTGPIWTAAALGLVL